MTWDRTRRFVAEFADGTRVLSRRYGEGWSHAEAWGHFCHWVMSRVRASGSRIVCMGQQYGLCLEYVVPEPGVGTMLGAESLPGPFTHRESGWLQSRTWPVSIKRRAKR